MDKGCTLIGARSVASTIPSWADVITIAIIVIINVSVLLISGPFPEFAARRWLQAVLLRQDICHHV